MDTTDAGRFEKEMAVLSALAERLKDQNLPIEQLAPLVEKALSQAAACDRLLREEESKVAAAIKQHGGMLAGFQLPRYF